MLLGTNPYVNTCVDQVWTFTGGQFKYVKLHLVNNLLPFGGIIPSNEDILFNCVQQSSRELPQEEKKWTDDQSLPSHVYCTEP